MKTTGIGLSMLFARQLGMGWITNWVQKKLGWQYWQKREKGIRHEALITRHDNPLWNVF